MESLVVEPIHCPACSTRYALRPGRLRPAHRRAQCFRCGGVFPLTEELRRALGAAPEAPRVEETGLEVNPFAAVDFDEVPDLPSASPFGEEPVERMSATPAASVPEFPSMPDTLTLGDLEGTEEEIFEKTLYVPSAETQPETRAASEEAAPDAPEVPDAPLTASGFSSARDAIAKLMSGAPTPMPSPMTGSASPAPDGLGVEETLSALEATLGGIQPSQLSADAVTLPGEAPAAPATPLSQIAPGSTMRLSRAEMLAAMATTAAEEAEAAGQQTLEVPASSLTTTVLQAPAAAPAPTPAPNPAETQPTAAAAEDPNLLRLKVGEEIYPALSMDQLVQWVEEGRVLESHQVARQFSENWLEAGKVPALRPVFERVRRAKGQDPLPAAPAPPESITPPKKGLFSGLFGRKDS